MGLNSFIDKRVAKYLADIGLDDKGIVKLASYLESEPGEGIQGPPGPQGPAGAPGLPGKSLHTGLGSPSANLGTQADTYVDLETGAVFVKE